MGEQPVLKGVHFALMKMISAFPRNGRETKSRQFLACCSVRQSTLDLVSWIKSANAGRCSGKDEITFL